MISSQDRIAAVNLIKTANDSGARLSIACAELCINVRTYERWIEDGDIKLDGRPDAIRPEPKNKLSEFERAAIVSTMNMPEFSSLPPTQVVPRLADTGVYIGSESTIYRTLKAVELQHHRGRSQKPVHNQPVTHIATIPNTLWSWDITWLPAAIKGMYYRLYLIIDIFSRKIVGWEVWETESSIYAEQLVSKAVVREGIKGKPLVLHSDNGSPMKASTFQVFLESLGITKSYSRPRVSNDNPYSESIFKTFKYRPGFPTKGFADIEASRKWVEAFVTFYNLEHKHSAIGFVTPNEKHSGTADAILCKRKLLYQEARKRHPERWARSIRKWDTPTYAALGPISEEDLRKIVAS